MTLGKMTELFFTQRSVVHKHRIDDLLHPPSNSNVGGVISLLGLKTIKVQIVNNQKSHLFLD